MDGKNKFIKDLYADIKNLYSYFPDEWKPILKDYNKTNNVLHQISREIPPEAYEFVRDYMVNQLFLTENKTSLPQLKFVVDSNIIVKDAFRVGFGKFSSTERIFSSVFLKLYAPKKIKDEVYEQINKDLPKGCSLELALGQAKKLLSKVEIIDDDKLNVENSSLLEFKNKYKNDVHFLKVAIGLNTPKIITRDKKAFDGNTTVKRYELGDAVSLILSVESGTLSLLMVTLGAETAYTGARVTYLFLSILYNIFTEILLFIIHIAIAGINGIINLLGKMPDWGWYIIIGIITATGIALIISKNLRDQATEKLGNLYEWITTQIIYSTDKLDMLIDLIKGTIDLTTMLKDDLGPYFINAGYIMTSSIVEMVNILSKER